jgi:glyoxylase-like metal-dependent hydrolase (beta-lactamase superfamily II)
VTPRVVPRRFDAHFFAAQLPLGIDPSFVESEVIAHAWMTPADALRARAAGEIGLWVPTSATLQELEHVRSFEDVEMRLAPGPTGSIRVVQEEPGLVRIVLPAAGGVPGQPVNAYLVGHQELVVVDPGDPSEAVVDTLTDLAGERRGAVRGVAITHADPDHYGGAEQVAMTLDIPIFAGPGAGNALPYDVTQLTTGEAVPVGDVAMAIVETPGHRADHLAFVSPDGWTLAGDLLGPGPSRSIVGAPDVAAWASSLDRLQALAARRVFPGHGEPISDTAAAVAETLARLGAPRRRRPSVVGQ